MNEDYLKHKEEKTLEISGVIEKGAGKGAYFTQVDWVVRQCRDKLNMTPYPGTLNVKVDDESLPRLTEFLKETDIELLPENPSFCAARVKKVTVNGVTAALVLPSEDVRIHDVRTIELIAAYNLKEHLGIKDGDTVTVSDAKNHGTSCNC